MTTPLRIFDKYELIRRLARGGMGDIFLARQVGLAGFSRLVVLKSLRPDVVERDEFFGQFLSEARTAALLNHPNVVAVFEVDEDRGVYFIAMEYIEGTDLSALVRAAVEVRQRVPFRVVAGVIHDAALGLHHAHTARGAGGELLGIIHRDVSPHNVMVRLDGITKVVDFGIASAAGATRSAGRIEGKIRYMAPEQLVGLPLTPAADQFALGIVLWELLTQRRLLSGDDATQVMRELAQGIPRPSQLVPGVPPALEATLLRMLAREPEQRWPSMRHVAAELRAFLDTTGGAADAQIARFVEVLAGETIKLRTQSLTPEPVVISGLLDPAELACPSCRARNLLRHRFCVECGAPLDAKARRSTTQVSAAPRRALASALEPEAAARAPHAMNAQDGPAEPTADFRDLLRTQAEALGALIVREQRDVIAVAVAVTRLNFTRAWHAPGSIDRRIVETLEQALEPFEAEVLALSPALVVLAIDDDAGLPEAALRALRAAAEASRALAKLGPLLGGELQARAIVARDRLEGVLGGRLSAAGRDAPVAALRARLDALPAQASGVFLEPAIAQRAVGRVRTSPATADLERLGSFQDPTRESRGPLFGRRNEVLAARELLLEAQDGRGGALVVVGRPGLGRSRVLEALAELAAKLGFAILTLRAGRGGAWLPGELPRELLRTALERRAAALEARAARVPDAPPPELGVGVQLASLGLPAALAEHVEGLLLGQGHPELIAQADEHLLGALAALTREQSLCIAIDDLHLADASSRRSMARLDAVARDARLVLFASADAASPGVLPGARVIELGPLADDKILAAAQAALDGQPLPPAVAQLVLVRAGGNPGTAVALVDALVRLGALRLAEGRWTLDADRLPDDLPHHLDELIGTQVGLLSKRAQLALRVAAVLGSPFDPALVASVVKLGADADRVWPELVGAGLVLRRADGELELAQASVETRLRRGVVAADRAEVHRRAATLLDAAAAASPSALVRAAHHFFQAGDARTGARTAARGAERLPHSRAALWSQAVDAYAELVALSPNDPELVDEATIALADALPSLASTDGLHEAVARARRFPERAPPGRPAHGRLVAAEVLLLLRLGRLDEAAAQAREARAALPDTAPAATRAALLSAEAAALEEQGRLSEAARVLQQAVALQDEGAESMPASLNALGRLFLRLGELDRARALLDAAESAAHAANDELVRAAALINRAALARARGELDHADAELDAAEACGRRAHDPLTLARCAYNRGALALARGDRAGAHRAWTDTQAVARQLDWPEGEAMAQAALASLGGART